MRTVFRPGLVRLQKNRADNKTSYNRAQIVVSLFCPLVRKDVCGLFHQDPVVQKVNSAIHRMDYYPADKYWQNQLCYPLDSDLSGG